MGDHGELGQERRAGERLVGRGRLRVHDGPDDDGVDGGGLGGRRVPGLGWQREVRADLGHGEGEQEQVVPLRQVGSDLVGGHDRLVSADVGQRPLVVARCRHRRGQ